MRKGFLLCSLGACLTLACLCLPSGWTVPPAGRVPPVSKATWTASPPTATARRAADFDPAGCLERLTPLLAQAENEHRVGIELEEEVILVTYTVSGDELISPRFGRISAGEDLATLQQDKEAQERVWAIVAQVTPDDLQSLVSQVEFFTDGVSGSLGGVFQTDNPHFWVLELDQLDADYYPELSTTLVHELAHLISLNDAQVITDEQVFFHPEDEQAYAQAEAACGTYFLFEGCSRVDSYIQAFFSRFWADEYPAWLEIDALTDDASREQAIQEYYRQHADTFVSEYAATSPEEDLAESFMYFVFSPPPTGDLISEQKMLFFYEYPELEAAREQMLLPLCSALGESGSQP